MCKFCLAGKVCRLTHWNKHINLDWYQEKMVAILIKGAGIVFKILAIGNGSVNLKLCFMFTER